MGMQEVSSLEEEWIDQWEYSYKVIVYRKDTPIPKELNDGINCPWMGAAEGHSAYAHTFEDIQTEMLKLKFSLTGFTYYFYYKREFYLSGDYDFKGNFDEESVPYWDYLSQEGYPDG